MMKALKVLAITVILTVELMMAGAVGTIISELLYPMSQLMKIGG